MRLALRAGVEGINQCKEEGGLKMPPPPPRNTPAEDEFILQGLLLPSADWSAWVERWVQSITCSTAVIHY